MIQMTKRAFVRLISFAAAAVLALSALTALQYTNAVTTKRQLEYNYLRSVAELSGSLENIKNTLNKGIYSTTPSMMSELSSKLWSDANAAKMSISTLPIEEMQLTNTYKFLSQVGNYSKSLSQKFADGTALTDEDKQNILQLYTFAQAVSQSLWNIENQLQNGWLTFEKAKEMAEESDEAGAGQNPAHIESGFADVESGFDNYPTLIYDGPFSDHIMQKEAQMLKDREAITQEEALKIANRSVDVEGLKFSAEEGGNIASYVFKSGNSTIAITKQGGFPAYYLNYRAIDSEANSITTEQAIKKAEAKLEELGFDKMTYTYYENMRGVMTINFAGVENNATLYTDLIKVGVALDDGSIISFDCCGYIMNHKPREISAPTFPESEARKLISPTLAVEDVQTCVIPSSGLNERYCYEYKAKDKEGNNVLVYINADTGREEQILLLQISENGMLTV
jgi:germination protein YpeB